MTLHPQSSIFYSYCLCSVLMGLGLAPLYAQTQTPVLQVATKTLQNSYAFDAGTELNLEGNNAEISVVTGMEPKVLLITEISAAHPDKKVATADLEKMTYSAERVKNKIYVRNYISSDAAKPASIFRVKYKVIVPAECPVYVKNSYGETQVNGLRSILRLQSDFTNVGLRNIQGNVEVRSRFGDVEGQNLDGRFLFNTRRSDVTLRDLKGSFDIETFLGALKLFAGKDITDLRLKSEMTAVTIFNPFPELFAYNIESKNARLDLPEGIKFQQKQISPDIQQITFRSGREIYPSITISITLGSLEIEK